MLSQSDFVHGRKNPGESSKKQAEPSHKHQKSHKKHHKSTHKKSHKSHGKQRDDSDLLQARGVYRCTCGRSDCVEKTVENIICDDDLPRAVIYHRCRLQNATNWIRMHRAAPVPELVEDEDEAGPSQWRPQQAPQQQAPQQPQQGAAAAGPSASAAGPSSAQAPAPGAPQPGPSTGGTNMVPGPFGRPVPAPGAPPPGQQQQQDMPVSHEAPRQQRDHHHSHHHGHHHGHGHHRRHHDHGRHHDRRHDLHHRHPVPLAQEMGDTEGMGYTQGMPSAGDYAGGQAMPPAGVYEGDYDYNVPGPGGYDEGETPFDEEPDLVEEMNFVEAMDSGDDLGSGDDTDSGDDMNPDDGTDSDDGTGSGDGTDSEDVILGPGVYVEAGRFPIDEDPMGGGEAFTPPPPTPPVEAHGGWVNTRPENLYHSEETDSPGGNPYYKKLPSVWGKTKYSKYSST